jgi:hypothetical protein
MKDLLRSVVGPTSLLVAMTVAGVVVAAAACSDSGGSEDTGSTGDEPVTGDGPLTQEGFVALLTATDVEDAATGSASLTTELRDLRSMAASVDPSQVVSIETWYGNSFVAGDGGATLTFTVIDFESNTAAEAHFEKLTSGSPAPQPVDPPIGDASAALRIDTAGIGSTLTFRSGDKIVTLHTTIAEGQPALVEMDALEELARIAAARLQ